jgi:hypothetical protein
MFSWLRRLLGTDFSRIEATVELIGALDPGDPDWVANRTVLYRVITPEELAGKYGIEGTLKSTEEINALKGTAFRIQRLGSEQYPGLTWPPALELRDGPGQSRPGPFAFKSARPEVERRKG